MALKKPSPKAKRRVRRPTSAKATDGGQHRRSGVAKTHAEELQKLAEAEGLLRTIKAQLPQLEALLAEAEQEYTIEDGVYRFYYDSMEIHELEDTTIQIVEALKQLAPHRKFDPKFTAIIARGYKQYRDEPETDTRYILEAFFHAHFMLRMACKYGRELEHAPRVLPGGWGTLLFLFGLR